MRTYKVLLVAALAVALLANLALAQASPAYAEESQRVGLVVDYIPGQSITIVDQANIQYQFELAALLNVLPPELAGTLKVGSYVTIIAPNKLPDGKHIAAGIVVHPKVPDGISTKVLEPIVANPTKVLEPTVERPTKVLEPTVENPTKVPDFTATVTETPVATATMVSETPTAVETVTETTTTPKITTSFIEWFRMLVRQIFANG
jgi:hypothetical protein